MKHVGKSSIYDSGTEFRVLYGKNFAMHKNVHFGILRTGHAIHVNAFKTNMFKHKNMQIKKTRYLVSKMIKKAQKIKKTYQTIFVDCSFRKQ